MKYLQSSFTMEAYRPNPDVCCEACVFKRGEHSEWCENAKEARRRVVMIESAEAMPGVERLLKRLAPKQPTKVLWPGAVGWIPRLYTLEIPSDCQFCPPAECGEFEAVAFLGSENGPAICSKCLRRMFPVE